MFINEAIYRHISLKQRRWLWPRIHIPPDRPFIVHTTVIALDIYNVGIFGPSRSIINRADLPPNRDVLFITRTTFALISHTVARWASKWCIHYYCRSWCLRLSWHEKVLHRKPRSHSLLYINGWNHINITTYMNHKNASYGHSWHKRFIVSVSMVRRHTSVSLYIPDNSSSRTKERSSV